MHFSFFIRVLSPILLLSVAFTGIQAVQSQTTELETTVWEFAELESNRVDSNRSYLPFLDVSSLNCGIYCLKAGAKDGQQPHAQDEIYYVESGVAQINIEGKDYALKKGSVVFVPARAKHHFHSITEDLKTMVFFSKGPVAATPAEPSAESDRKTKSDVESAMTFLASFNSGTDANLFDTHGWICTADSVARKNFEVHNGIDDVTIAKGQGVLGDCLRFQKKTKAALFYKAREAAGFYPRPDWKGTISFWLKLDPNKDLGDGYCDPLQVAGRKWNDGAIWVDFDDVKPRTFRLGVFSDLNVWNPKGIKWEEFPEQEKPLVTVENPPFRADKWTHVAITFANINSTQSKQSSAKLYLDGKLRGTINRPIQISWDEKSDPPAAVMLGLNYVGDLDDLMFFNRDLNAREVDWIRRSVEED